MLQINPKKFKPIKNKTIPNAMRPKFRNKAQSNIYFLSQRKVTTEKKEKILKNIKMISIFIILLTGGVENGFLGNPASLENKKLASQRIKFLKNIFNDVYLFSI